MSEEKDLRLRIFLRVDGTDRCVEVDAKMWVARDSVGTKLGMFYVDFGGFRIEMGQDLLDELWSVMIWFVSREKVEETVKEYFEKSV